LYEKLFSYINDKYKLLQDNQKVYKRIFGIELKFSSLQAKNNSQEKFLGC
jgi:hypothetical protein